METALNTFILDRVTLVVEQTTYVGDLKIAPTTRLADDLELGGFGLVKLALYLEELFDIELTDDALERFLTVGDIVKHLTRNFFQDADCSELAKAA
jgi:acyl carrier protein